MKIPIYVDSPMAVQATEAFQANSSSFDEETKSLILSGDNPFFISKFKICNGPKRIYGFK